MADKKTRFVALLNLAVLAIWLAAVGLLMWFVFEGVEAVKSDGLQGVMLQLWCGEKGCK